MKNYYNDTIKGDRLYNIQEKRFESVENINNKKVITKKGEYDINSLDLILLKDKPTKEGELPAYTRRRVMNPMEIIGIVKDEKTEFMATENNVIIEAITIRGKFKVINRMNQGEFEDRFHISLNGGLIPKE